MSSVRADQTQSNGSMKILKLEVVSAKGLNHVHLISTMNPFAARRPTHVIKKSRNFQLVFDQLPESELQQNRFTLVFRIRSQGLFGNRKVVMPIDLDSSRDSGTSPVKTKLRVTTSSGKYKVVVAPLPEDKAPEEKGKETTPDEGRETGMPRRLIERDGGMMMRRRRPGKMFEEIEEREKLPFPAPIKVVKNERKPVYDLSEALQLVKGNAKSNFDETIEAHVRLGIDRKRSDLK